MFDQPSLDLLKRFTDNVCIENRDQMCTEKDWVDEPGTRPGIRAATKYGSLVGFMIARYGTDDPALDDRDWELLREWFREGMPTGQRVQR